MKLYVCHSCFGVSACYDKEFKKCSNCLNYIKGKIPCKAYLKATQVVKDYECDMCMNERLKQMN